MKVSPCALFFIAVATAHTPDEIDLIRARKGKGGGKGKDPTVPINQPRSTACTVRQLDATMLISKYGMNITDPEHLSALSDAVTGNLCLGSITQLLPEASDAGRVGILAIDGVSGDTNLPFGSMKPLMTVGEINQCDENFGEVYVGVPDGMGAYLKDDHTVRLVVQSESYGPLLNEAYPWYVNEQSASFTGSHIQYTDFDRESFAEFMTHSGPAMDMIKGFGQVASVSYNLAGEKVGPRNPSGPTTSGAHFSNTAADGTFAMEEAPSEADWLMQSLCSAHLEESHQWGPGMGFEDDIFLTNEEWINYEDGKEFVGISAHAINLATGEDWAVGATTQTGFEKIVEMNPQSTDHVVLALSGYNGAYRGNTAELEGRAGRYGTRPDGKDYAWTENICPARIYIGVKGKMEDGSDAPDDDFLARNGLRYGKVYGFAIDMAESGPTEGLWRDEFHKPRSNGAKVEGKWIPIDWQWDGKVKNFRHDGAWEFQRDPPGFVGSTMKYWNANGYDESGSKTEHVSPDTRAGITAFIQGSTAGYFGHYYIHELGEELSTGTGLPASLDGTYHVYQGENDITAQVNIGTGGLLNMVDACPGAVDATVNCDNDDSVKRTFEDIDGLELINSAEGLYAIIQEDSGNELGERMFITKLEHDDDGAELEYMFMAQSGGKYNTRMSNGVGIPAGTNGAGGSHEFSGIVDMSGMLKRNTGEASEQGGKGGKKGTRNVRRLENNGASTFAVSAGDGAGKRAAEATVPINEKLIALGLQAHNLDAGVVRAFKADRGGQVLLYQPNV